MIIDKSRYYKFNFLKSYIKLFTFLSIENLLHFFSSKKRDHKFNILLPARNLDSSVCKDCEICQRLCPDSALGRRNGKPLLDLMRCSSCQYCITVCPEKLIELKEADFLFVSKKDRFRTL